ncbi:CoA transferase subunit A [Ornithinimicrobium ciconiae]|uniref:CoA transferase subunit A n=1 Tax=Ornithinimicrobium ciconiae TaxID=2594265 RepID=A0A516GCK6_9MICO|nr:CoA transferase subunit A [Ornithinimicrobium ciconiae]QDO89251.1 CoA transferase subunit A [Ornithinimicrobium ciconiae]
MDKVVSSAEEAVEGIEDGMTLTVGGFGISGIPAVLIDAVLAKGATNLELVSNNCGIDGAGLGVLLAAQRVGRVIASYVGENKEFARQYLSGELEVELTPQGTLAERMRSAGAGIPAFWTPTGVGSLVSEGGMPWLYDSEGNVIKSSPPKEKREYTVRGHTREYVLEDSIFADFGLVHAAKGDRHGNLVFNKSARNFNPLCAMAAGVAVAQVEELVEPGEIDPDDVHLPGIYVQRVLALTPEQVAAKDIEKRTTRPRPAANTEEA